MLAIEEKFERDIETIRQKNDVAACMKVQDILRISGYRKKKLQGHIGIEIEVEGRRLPHQEIYEKTNKIWKYVPDGSLRGEENAEYVLSKPLKINDIDNAVDVLWQQFGAYNSRIDPSHRTSVHLHFNVMDWHLENVAAFFTYYFMVEDILADYCGESRKGNHFCLRGRDAPRIVSKVSEMIGNPATHLSGMSPGFKYGGINPWSIGNLGSIEVRLAGGTAFAQDVKDWVNICNRIYEASSKCTNPTELVVHMSSVGYQNFLEELFGEYLETLSESLDMSPSQVEESVYNGMRLAQEIAYSRDWSYDQDRRKTFRPDFFGRNPADKAKKFIAGDDTLLSPQSLSTVYQEYLQSYEESLMNGSQQSNSTAYSQPSTASLQPTLEPNFTIEHISPEALTQGGTEDDDLF